MRIVHIGTSEVPVLHPRGGALQRRILELTSEQGASGHDVVVFSPGKCDAERVVDGGIVVEFGLRARRPARDFEFLWRAANWMRRRQRCGVLHAHGAPFAGRSLGRYCDAAVQSVDFFEYRATHGRAGHRVYADALGAFETNLPVSQFCQRGFESYYPSERGRTEILYNGVNPVQFSRRGAVGDVPECAEPGRYVLYVGRVCEQKGSDLLGPIASQLQAKGASLNVVAAGPYGQFGRQGDALSEFGVGGELVSYLGAVTDEVLVPLMQNAAAFVLPTRRDEMFGMVALESIAAGTPVVGSDLGGIPEAIGTCGRLAPVGDVDGFVDQLMEIGLDPSARAKAMSGAASHVDGLSWAAIARSCADMYGEALDRASR